jgi:hypothetical protein
MATGKTNGGTHDASAQRLLDAIGCSELDYFSAADERAVAAALQTWPLLASISRALSVERAANESGVRRAAIAPDGIDPPLRVVEPAGPASGQGESIEDADSYGRTEPPHKES